MKEKFFKTLNETVECIKGEIINNDFKGNFTVEYSKFSDLFILKIYPY
jgi:hypothetical protein